MPKKSLDQSWQQLEKIMEEFQSDQLSFEDSLKKFEQGIKLAKHLKTELTKYETQIQQIKATFDEKE